MDQTNPSPSRPWSPMRFAADRTAVLVLGLVAGFAVGASFAGRGPAVAVPERPVPAASPVARPSTPENAAVDPRVVTRVARTGTIRVGVFGDSFGVGIWDALYRLLPKDEGYEVLRLGHEATGFTRYRVEDLSKRARDQLAANPIDVAVISLGVNDAQDMWEGKLYPFMSPEWKRVVGERIDGFVKVAGSTGAPVYWVGLPSMRDPELDAKVQALNALFAEHMARLGIPYIDTRPLSVDAQGHYASHLPLPGSDVPRLVRTGDGIHMIGVGYQRLLPAVVTKIQVFAAKARAAAKAGGSQPR